ncbi:MAG: SGNH/GDSL hydrolase family protein [Burkholderiales bacterium]
MQGTIKRLLGAALLAAGLAAGSAQANPYTGLFIFGDSLSDTGNLSILSGGAFPGGPPYAPGRFSDGPVWVEHLAAGLGLPGASNPSIMGGNNYAIAGARTGIGGFPPGVGTQLGAWGMPPGGPPPGGLGAGYAAADPNALYVLVAGGNDMRDARTFNPTLDAAGDAGRQAAAVTAINNLAGGLAFLASRGAQHVMIANLPDLGGSPEAGLLGLQAASSDATDRFNALIPTLMGFGAGLGIDMRLLDLAGLLEDVVDDALNNGGAQFGITNVSAPCVPFPFHAGNACAESLFSDALHPSARAHELIGAAALRLAVPEPGTLVLVGAALLLVGMRRRA